MHHRMLVSRFSFVENSLNRGDIDTVEGIKSLFRLGHSLELRGFKGEAERLYTRTIELLESARKRKVAPLADCDFARCALSHGIWLFRHGRVQLAKAAFTRAVEVLRKGLPNGTSIAGAELLAISLHWLACAQRQSARIHAARKNRLKASRRSAGIDTKSDVDSPSAEGKLYHQELRKAEESYREALSILYGMVLFSRGEEADRRLENILAVTALGFSKLSQRRRHRRRRIHA